MGQRYIEARMEVTVLHWTLVTCLLLHAPLLDCVTVHLSELSEPGTVVAGLRAGRGCVIYRLSAPKFIWSYLETDRTAGTVRLSRSLLCSALSTNPFPIRLTARCPGGGSGRSLDFTSISSRLDLHVHGPHCFSKHRRKERRGVGADVEVVVLQNSPCLAAGRPLLALQDLLPASRQPCDPLRCQLAGSPFLLSRDGQLRTRERICLEGKMSIRGHVLCPKCATEGGSALGNVTIELRVGDESSRGSPFKQLVLGRDRDSMRRSKRNVNTSPQFQPPIYQVSVPENMPPGTRVISVRAVDPDEGDAGRVEYSMDALFDSRSNSLFVIESATGVVTTAESLDRETKDTHVFRVTGVDHGTPRRTAMATLTVTVSDSNDHDPLFEQQEYKESVRENLEIGYEVLTVRATDGDAPPNANILYQILNGQGQNAVFEIDPRSGVMRTRGPVDREMVEYYQLLVEANDQGRNPGPRSSTATVHITVEDDNDNTPQFSEKRYIIQVLEDIAPNTKVLQVTASDRDKGNNAVVHYSIMSGNTRGQFYIDAQTGSIDVVSHLDYETNKEYTLRIRAQDGGRPPLSNITGLVTVQVVDVNDNAPIFVSTPFQSTVLENVPIGYSVLHVQAIDADSGNNSRLEYKLINTSPDFPFSINNNTGWIVVSSELDREMTDFYRFGVEARDQGSPAMSSSASISITVLDVNDNNPEFTQKLYQIRLNEDAAVGSSVVTVSAIDRDVNSVVTYQISNGNTRNRFSITSQSGGGLITLALPLDYKLERQYILTVTASDGTRFDTVQVFINVTDANTHRPVFQSSHYTVNINEDKSVGTTVVIISATDEDTGENARITYFMEDSIPQFKIEPDLGAVTTLMDLDYEDQVSYTLAITAKDNGIPQKSDTTYLEILVNDVNDNSPQFLRDHYQGSVYEDVPTFTSVLQISATDRDSGLNGRVFYTFQGGDDGDGDFIIETTSGIVRTLRRLDRENVQVYNLKAFAVDKGIPAMRTPIDIQIVVLDVNDNPPVFEKDEFDIFVDENSPIGLVVSRITATDPDEGTNAQIMYQIVEGNIPEVFQLDIFSGELTALMDLDYESKSEYIIVVQATSAPLVSRATVHIRLLDKNDNVPVLKNFEIIFNNYVTNKSSSFPTGIIGRIPAHDPDVSDSLYYKFDHGNELNLVILNQTTGELSLSHALDNNRPLEATMRVSVSGSYCEVNSRSGRCSPGICRNGGACVNLLVGGFKCDCLPGEYEKPYCEMTTRSFPRQSFITFKGLRQRFHFSISLTFATKEKNALLLYNGRFNEKHDFIALEIINEQVQLTFSAGESTTLVTPYIPGGVSDGMWHTVQLQYYNKPYIGKSGVPQGPSEQKVAVVTVDDCDTSVALRFGRFIGNYSCSAQGTQSGSKKSLDLTGPLLLGGVPNLPEDFPLQNHEFMGCMKNLLIDNQQIDMADFIANNGTVSGCSAKWNFCDSNTCKNGGTCVNRWETFSCECPLGFGGKNCEQVMANPQRFLGNSLVSWSNLVSTITLPWYIGLMFRTRQANGLFIQADAGQFSTISIQLSEGNVMLNVYRSSSQVTALTMEQLKVNDGDWHHLQLELRSSKNGKETKYTVLMSIDYGHHQTTMEIGNELHGLKLKMISIGGVPGNDGSILHGFRGCMQGVRIGETPLTAVALNINHAEKVNVERGCNIPDPCDSSPCPTNSYCSDDWDSYSCSCDPGYYGEECKDVCSLNPCEHLSVCSRKPSSSHGYTCDCTANYFGQYCETKIDQPCPRGWWGHPMCGPCSCDVRNGFDADCNKTSGECRCKDNYYWPPGTNACLPCDCYSVGSLSRSCDMETGQCQCKPGVIGRQCDRCDNPFAEVFTNGCEVIYDSCPRAMESGIWWPRTKFGLPAAVPCPKGSMGTGIRHCDEHRGWLPPDLFNCTTSTFAELKTFAGKLKKNETLLDVGKSKEIALLLWNATQHTTEYFGSDVKIAYHVTSKILEFENSQRGFNLAATQDVQFTENLIKVGSAILDISNKKHWDMIQQTDGGTALLLRHYEDYASALAKNMRKTYLNPFTIVTPNIVISVDRLHKINFSGVKLPRYDFIRGQKPRDLETIAILPESIFTPADVKENSKLPTSSPEKESTPLNRKKRHPDPNENDAIASIIIYWSLGELLPEQYDPDKRSLRVPKRPVINSPIVSIAVHDNDELLQHQLAKPIRVQYKLFQTEERTKPICVFWNHSIPIGGTGGWSSKGCELVFRNESHISCQCSHMTSFAVLMDISRRENGEILPLKLITYSTVGVTLGALLLSFLILLLLRSLRSNQHSISKNMVVALFFSELIFLFGINQADNPFVCTVIAILLHFFYMCTFAWMFLEGLHIYRMLNEVRDINYGPMRFYYMIGWGVPAFITGLAVGLDPEGYGNPDFCWLSIYDTLIWSFAGPISAAVSMNVFLYILSAKASCRPRHQGFEKKGNVSGLRTAFVVLLLVSCTWLLALLSVNSDTIIFHYLFAGFNCLQGPFIFIFRCILNKEVRKAFKCVFSKKNSDETVVTTKSTLASSLCNNTYIDGRTYRSAFGDSSGSVSSASRSGKSHNSYIAFVLREEATLNNSSSSQAQLALTDHPTSLFHEIKANPDEHDSDSDSDLSLEDDQSGSYASTHSSDSEEDEEYQGEPGWENIISQNNEKHPNHSTPKVENISSHVTPYWPGEFMTTASESEDHGGSGNLKVETVANIEPHREKFNHVDERPKENGDNLYKENVLTSLPNPNAQPQKGILKNRGLPLFSEKNSINRIHNELSNHKSATVSSRASSVGSSEGSRSGGLTKLRQTTGEHMNGMMPIPMSIKTGTVDEDSSGSDSSDETSI
ncbi:cadherin EGF LAG seven-pass G-type receptor 2 isoform X3 [Mobula birostris]|uniref:cadherin EGF LAG seven-pass G-type receptor 2 isoform X3 n=1 Tax=Mobula birostris TaxID=1983395 RepID=UPI003B285B76